MVAVMVVAIGFPIWPNANRYALYSKNRNRKVAKVNISGVQNRTGNFV